MTNKVFDPLVDEVFFIGVDKMGIAVGEHEEAYLAYKKWFHSITLETFEDAFIKIRMRWLSDTRENVFDAISKSEYFYAVLSQFAFKFAWDYYKDFDNRDLTSITFIEAYKFTYADIDRHGYGYDDVDKWTKTKEDIIWPNVIVIENYKGNCTYLPEDVAKCKYFNAKGNPTIFKVLRDLCLYFPEYNIGRNY